MLSNLLRSSRRTILSFAVPMLALAGTAWAAELPPVDALYAQAQPQAGATRAAPATIVASYEKHLGIPSFVSAGERHPQRAGVLQVGADPAGVARAYLRDLAGTYRITTAEVDALPVTGQQRLPGGAVLVQFGHTVQGVEVFRDRASVLVGADGRLVGIGGYVSGAGAVARVPLSRLFRDDAATAVSRALADYGQDAALTRAQLVGTGEQGPYQVFSLANDAGVRLLSPARAKPVLFRQAAGLVPAYYVEVEVAAGSAGERDSYYAYVISAKNGSLLFRHDLTADASAFNYRVWAEPAFPYLPYPGPQGRNGIPNPTGQPDGYQAPFVAPNLVGLVNALPSTSVAANDPWLPDRATETTGNNVEAFANLAPPDGFGTGDLRGTVTAPGTFDRVYDTGRDPQASDDQIQAAITQLFYMNNWLHDWYYDAGFDEASGNAQTDNYRRGGLGNDSIRAQAQDYSGTDNANMATPADGARPRMRMYVFSAQSASMVENASSAPGVPAQMPSQGATFGPGDFDLLQQVVVADDGVATGGSTADACEPLVSSVAGKIALVERGKCNFTDKVVNAQNAGAIGVLIYNNVDDGTLPGMGGTNAAITVASLGITAADGLAIRGAIGTGPTVMRMLRVNGIRRDGTIDNTIVAHEWGHYISNRLVQNSAGLTTLQSAGMGEGFGDFHSMLMSVKAEDAEVPANFGFGGVYAMAGYVSGGPSFPVNPNLGYYNGIRRYPYSTSFERNPLTFRHIENGVPLPVDPPPAFGQSGADNSEVHNTGEVWANMLWECYAALLRDNGRLGFDQAQERMKTYLVAGYKLMPPGPTFTEARDAILSVAQASDPDDFRLCAGGFARRGLGAGAVAPDRDTEDNAGVVESYTTRGSLDMGALALDDDGDSCDMDGVLDNGEQGSLRVTLRNAGFQAISAVTLDVDSPDGVVGFPSPSLTLPGIEAMSSRTYAVPIALDGAPGLSVITVNVSASAPGVPAVDGSAMFRVASDTAPGSATGDDFESDLLVWTPSIETLPNDPAFQWARVDLDGDALAHVMHAPDNGGPGKTILASPAMQVADSGDFVVSFRHRYRFEADASANYDGGVVEISLDDGATWQDVTAAGGTMTPAYNGTLSNCCSNPLANRQAFVKSSAGMAGGTFDDVSIDFGTALAGQSVRIRFLIATDAAAGEYGWDIDDFSAPGIDNTPFPSVRPDSNACSLDIIFQDGFD